jgi:hypothetical protein
MVSTLARVLYWLLGFKLYFNSARKIIHGPYFLLCSLPDLGQACRASRIQNLCGLACTSFGTVFGTVYGSAYVTVYGTIYGTFFETVS